jgi:hypothetical protein
MLKQRKLQTYGEFLCALNKISTARDSVVMQCYVRHDEVNTVT